MIRVLELEEWGIAAGVDLSHDEVRALQLADAGLKVVAAGVPGHFDIEATDRVGSVATRDLRVVIRPKLPIRRLLYLLGFASEAAVFFEGGLLGEARDLLDVMQALYAQALDRALRLGPLEGYVSREERLVGIRGRVDYVGLAFKRFGIAPPFECRFDEFTADIELNRRLLGAAIMLQRSDRSTSASRLLGVLQERFGADVGVTHRLGPVDHPVALDRRTQRFERAARLAELVLRGSSLELDRGRLDAVGFLVDMNDAFEEFMSTLLKTAVRASPANWLRHPTDLWLDEEETVALEPDIVWLNEFGQPQLVIDLKYKLSEVNADIYQMLAYCTALGLEHGILVYAAADEAVHNVRENGIQIHVVQFDPDGEPDELDARANSLAMRLNRIAISNEAISTE